MCRRTPRHARRLLGGTGVVGTRDALLAVARTAVAAAAPLTLAGAAGAAPVGAQEAPTYEEGFFEVFVQRLPARVTVTTLVDAAGRVLVPLDPVLELVGIPVRREEGRRTLEWPPAVWRTDLDLEARTVRVGDAVETFDAGEWVVRDGTVYLTSAALGRILAARVDVDWAGLGIVITENLEFPASRRLQLEAERERRRLLAERLRPEAPDLAFEPRTGGFAATWGMSVTGADGQYRSSLRTAVGGSVWGGATEVGGVLTGGAGSPETLSDTYLRFSRVFPDGPVRQIQVGSVLADGPVARRIQGVTLTNEPFTTPRFFGEAVVEPAVPAGWEYELYQGDVLVGVSSAGAAEGLRAPLNYGNTPIRVRLIGPAGQERSEELLYVVPPSRLRAGEVRWNAGLGPCQDPSCDSYAYGELRGGLASWLTAGLGLDRFDPVEGSVKTRPWASMSLTPLRRMNVDARFQPGAFFSSTLDLATPERGVYSATWAWSRPVGDAPTLDGWYAQVSASTPLNFWGGRSVTTRLQLRGGGGRGVDSWMVTTASAVRRAYVSASFESGLQDHAIVTGRAFMPLGPDPRWWRRDLALSTGLGLSGRGGELLEVGASVRPTERETLSVDFRARRGTSPTVSLGVTSRRAAAYVQGRGSSGQGAGLFIAADGGLAYDGVSGVLPLPFQSLGRAGVQGRVFHDRDGDGVQDPDETPAVGVVVNVQGDRVITDAEGRYRTWEVRPYDVLDVAVDSLSVDPAWIPDPRSVQLRPSPNLFNTVDLPLRPTREVTGRVVLAAENGDRPVGGVQVRVVDADGRVVATQRTFSDGVYYFQRIPPGAWTVEVAPASRDAVSAPAAPARATIDTRLGGDLPVDVPDLRLVPGSG